MTFEIGKKYLCRNGEIVTVTDISTDLLITTPKPQYNEYIGTELRTNYFSNGTVTVMQESDWDIISEYIEPNLDGTSDYLETKSNTNEVRGNGGSTSYYNVPEDAKVLGDLIKHKKMEHGIGEAFCALYRLNDNGEYKRNLTKAKYYIEAELKWLDKQVSQ